jgi:hypothetical protein
VELLNMIFTEKIYSNCLFRKCKSANLASWVIHG